jgi:hypothetical protein
LSPEGSLVIRGLVFKVWRMALGAHLASPILKE